MPRNASGTVTLPTNDSSPAAPRNVIRSSDFNELMGDISTELTDSWSRSGKGAALADLDIGGFNLLNPGNLQTAVANRTSLKSLDTTKVTLAYLKEAGREGVFKWTTGNFSTQITADTNEGIYIKADAIASTAGAWVRKFDRQLSTAWFNTTEQTAIGEIFELGGSTPYMYMADSHIGIVKDTAPLNYHSTRASVVIQHADTASGAAQELIPGIEIDFDFSGDGVVDAPNRVSETIWTALNVFTKKSGNGSAHCFTSAGELSAPAASGYNELGGFQGSLTNVGSSGGNISGLEFLVKDSPNATTLNSYATYGKPVISRGARYNAGGSWQSFLASSEGNTTIDSVLALNPDGSGEWNVGIDFTGRSSPFSTGYAMLLPNNNSIGSKDSGGTIRSLMFLDGSDRLQLAFAGNKTQFGDLAVVKNTKAFASRNAANSADVSLLSLDASNVIQFAPANVAQSANRLTFTGAESNQLAWSLGGQEWRANMASGGNWYLFDVTHTVFPLTVAPSAVAVNITTTGLAVAGAFSFNPATTTTAPAAGGAGALPATPLGYATITINGTARKVAYYA